MRHSQWVSKPGRAEADREAWFCPLLLRRVALSGQAHVISSLNLCHCLSCLRAHLRVVRLPPGLEALMTNRVNIPAPLAPYCRPAMSKPLSSVLGDP